MGVVRYATLGSLAHHVPHVPPRLGENRPPMGIGDGSFEAIASTPLERSVSRLTLGLSAHGVDSSSSAFLWLELCLQDGAEKKTATWQGTIPATRWWF